MLIPVDEQVANYLHKIVYAYIQINLSFLPSSDGMQQSKGKEPFIIIFANFALPEQTAHVTVTKDFSRSEKIAPHFKLISRW